MNGLLTTAIILALLPFIVAAILALLATAYLLRSILWRIGATFLLALLGLYAYSNQDLNTTIRIMMFVVVYFGIGGVWVSLWEKLKEEDVTPPSDKVN